MPTDSGVQVRFDLAVDTASLDLADAVLKGAVHGAMRGSVVPDADRQGFSFVRTGGALPADSYTLTVRSGPDGVRAAGGGTLDGDRDGTAGDAFNAFFSVPDREIVSVSIPDVVRSPSEAVVDSNASLGGLRLPVAVSQAEGITRVAFTLRFDPALLDLKDVRLAQGYAGTLNRTAVAGGVRVEARFQAPLGRGPASPVELVAQVAPDAPYGAAQVLDLTDVELDGADGTALAVRGDEAVQIAAHLLDANGDGQYSSADLQEMLAVLVGAGGFTGFPAIDPTLIGDLNGNGKLTTLDANRFRQFLAGQARQEISAPPLLPLVGKAAAREGGTDTIAPQAQVTSTVAWNETWAARAGTVTAPGSVAPSASATAAANTDWTNAPWAIDLAQRMRQMSSGGALRTLSKTLVKKL